MPVLNAPVVLASASPRRRELLETLGILATVAPVDADERVLEGESPDDYVMRVARAKLEAALPIHPADSVVIAADTIVRLGSSILGKPSDDEHAVAMLRSLSGREHAVTTAVVIGVAGSDRFVAESVTTAVRFRVLDETTIARYVALGEGRDKAGGYGIQGVASGFVASIEGSYSNVVGLPVVETLSLLTALGALASWP